MDTKFKIGDQIHFMKNNVPMSEKIKGISIHNGEINELYYSQKPEEGTKILYHYDSYGSVNEEDAYKSIDDLKNTLFPENSDKSK